jgi:tetratricopeptide (TPR) repeat protein
MTTESLPTGIQERLDRFDIDGALSFCRKHLESAPQEGAALRYFSQLLALTGDFDAAHRAARNACELTPEDSQAWFNLGSVYARERRFAEAARCFLEALTIDRAHADAWHNLGVALKRLGDRQAAFRALKAALAIESTRAVSYLELGNLLFATGQAEDALECLERAAKCDVQLTRARSRRGEHLSARGKVSEAKAAFTQSIALDPDHIQGWYGLGRALEDLGERDSALECYLNVIRRKPAHAHAIGQYLALVRDEPGAEVLQAAIEALQTPSVANEAKATIGYGLLKYYDRRGDHASAASIGRQANAARRAAAGPQDRSALCARIQHTIDHFDRRFFEARRRFGLGTDQPVFIVGLPRSGTTLLEQALSAHPLIHGAGELQDLSRIAASCVGEGEGLWSAPLDLTTQTSQERAFEYLRSLRDGAPRGRLRITDKAPLNFFNLAFAAVLFPNAYVIHCTRDPRDTALSIWMENFSVEQRYSTDFGDLAFFTQEHRRLMAHWREHLPLRTLQVRYEDMIGDLEAQMRRVVRFLQLPWDSRCLQFHQNDRAVQTPSRWQVRQPLYSGSVNRWTRYERFLPELPAAFASFSAEQPIYSLSS